MKKTTLIYFTKNPENLWVFKKREVSVGVLLKLNERKNILIVKLKKSNLKEKMCDLCIFYEKNETTIACSTPPVLPLS